MLTNSIIPARDLQKSYKSIINDVRTTRSAVVLTTSGKPQAALVSLEDLEELRRVKARQASLDMLTLAIENREELKRLPADLREQANKILYTTRK